MAQGLVLGISRQAGVAELLNAYDAMLEAAVTKRFLKVRTARSICIDNPNLMGPKVLSALPAAKSDIIEAGNCLAAECHTACVFHLMRVVECGLRAFCAHLGFRKLRITKKSGKTKLVQSSPLFPSSFFLGQPLGLGA